MTDPGHPEVCNVCHYWKQFAPEQSARVWQECRTATRGCVQNKQELAEVLVRLTEPYRAGATRPAEEIERLLQEGAKRARAVAQGTMAEVKRVVGLAAVEGRPVRVGAR